MVVKLTGTIEGHPVICERVSGDTWTCTVPATLSGTYVVEFTAVDDAGNISGYARYIITIDLASIHVRLIPCPYYAELIQDQYGVKLIPKQYYAALHECEV